MTGLDLDPAMIGRARANADRSGDGDERGPSFLVGDVASLAFPDGSFDVVVSTLSMHHWADPKTGLFEIARMLRPGGRALVRDFRAGYVPLTGACPIRLTMQTAFPSEWRARRHGAGPGGSTSSVGSSSCTPTTSLDTSECGQTIGALSRMSGGST